MSYQRTRMEVLQIPDTKSVILTVEYAGELEKDTALAKESMCLLLGDAWHAYAVGLGLDPVRTMKMIDAHICAQKATKQ